MCLEHLCMLLWLREYATIGQIQGPHNTTCRRERATGDNTQGGERETERYIRERDKGRVALSDCEYLRERLTAQLWLTHGSTISYS